MNTYVQNKAVDLGFSLALVVGVGVALWWVGKKATEAVGEAVDDVIEAAPEAAKNIYTKHPMYLLWSAEVDLVDDFSLNGSNTVGSAVSGIYDWFHWGDGK